MHAIELTKTPPETWANSPIVVLWGTQSLLKSQVIERLVEHLLDGDAAGLTRFAGKGTDWPTVHDELATQSMWSVRRIVVVDDADEFISHHRPLLEKYVTKPARKAVLVLSVATWPKNTRLYKLVAEAGLDVECTELKTPALLKWLVEHAERVYQRKLQREAAQLLAELIGCEFGMLDQELAKLASYVGPSRPITFEDVRLLVGGWRTETNWAMTDAVRDGDLPHALAYLHDLLHDGEPALKLLGGVASNYRKLAKAAALARHMPLKDALKSAGVMAFGINAGESYLRRIGRQQAEHLYDALLAADCGMKGATRLTDQTQMEMLLIKLSGLMDEPSGH